MTKRLYCIAALLLAALASASALGAPALLRTVAPLDEPRGYCVDIAGFRESLRLDDPLQAHTCKYGAPHEDQLFDVGDERRDSRERVRPLPHRGRPRRRCELARTPVRE